MKQLKALLIDDDAEFRESLEVLVAREGFETRQVGTLGEARGALRDGDFDVVLVDRMLPDGDGLEFIRQHDDLAGAEVIAITGNADVDSAVEALRSGALDYLTKPVDRSRLKSALSNVSRTRALKETVSNLRGELRGLGRFGRIIGRSKQMQRVFDLIARVAPTDASVLITGESGTGKEIVASTVHELSRRKNGPLEAVNCGAIPEGLIESELFGHERGSFTGAEKTRKGFFERADGGTLLLDEITEMPIDLQVKLLRVLETGTVKRLGAGKLQTVDVRVLAATNRDPLQAIEDGKLRQDLYYRLAVFPILLPPLRERPGDIELLAESFLKDLNEEHGTRKRWSSKALQLLETGRWEGNVRELRNAVHRAYILAEEELGPEAVDPTARVQPAASPEGNLSLRVGSSIAELERKLILATLDHVDGGKPEAARLLGISVKTLYTRLKEYRAAMEGVKS